MTWHIAAPPAEERTAAAPKHFPVRIWYLFLMSKCREESDLGLCMTSGFAKRMPLRSTDFQFWNVFGGKIRRKSALRSGILIVQKFKMLALGVCLPQLCPSACSRFAPSRSRLNHYRTIDSFPRKRTWWNALWTGFFWIRTLDSNRTHPYLNKRFVQEIETPSPTGSEKKYFLSQKVFFSCMWSKSTQKVLFFLYVIQKYFYSPKMVVWYEDNINL